MRFARLAVIAALSVFALQILRAAPDPAVRVWRGTVQIPTYAEDGPNQNPPFDLFSFGRFNYPYPIRDALTTRREVVTWRSLHLENEYLRVTVLPDLGGHLYSCLDKRTGREMFYANSTIKKALIGYRGAWAALGIEFNFPVSHNWMSISPVDFATATHPDGSGSIWVGNKDQVYGSEWRVEMRLRPGRSLLEESVKLHNPSDVRHRYYWWTNAAVQVWDDSHLVYPTELMATHGFTSVEPWPVDRQGRDLSVIRNQLDGPVSLFTYKTREPFVGVYHPHTNSGTVHLADPAELPAHKVWSWGYDRDAANWRTALSDDDSGYIELQAGLFRNQETYAFLEPQETVRFSEYWLPVRDLGGITRANTDAILYMARSEPARMSIALDVTRDLPGGRIKVLQGTQSLVDTGVNLSPREVWRATVSPNGNGPVRLELTDGAGHIVLNHLENTFDRVPASEETLGPTSNARPRAVTASSEDVIEDGMNDELEGRRLIALSKYRAGLERYPHSLALLKAAGRLSVALTWPDASTDAAARSIGWLEEAYTRNTTDFETRYYLGLALLAADRTRDARPHLEAAQRFRATHAGATIQLARLFAREGHQDAALQQIRTLASEEPQSTLAAGLEVTLLRRLGRTEEARDRARHWLEIEPTSSLLRYERTLGGDADPDLWPHLGADANRVLDLVDQYFAIGDYQDALGLLDRTYPDVTSPAREVGAVRPSDSPLIAYYRGFARARSGGSANADYARATSLSTAYVFPNRRSSYAVLNAALQANPADPTARFLLGSLYLANGLVEPAIAEWQRVRSTHSPIPTLHRSLGMALLLAGDNDRDARAVLEEGLVADGSNMDVYLALDGVLSASGASPRERAAALRRFPNPERMPSPMVFKLALALSEAGDATGAEALFHDRFFPQEEGGTSVRAVYAQVRLTSARLAATSRDCDTARRMLDALAQPQQGLAFTAGGLEDTLRPPTMARQAAVIESNCGRRDAARTRWDRLVKGLNGGGGPLGVAVADDARARLGVARTDEDRRRLEESLESAARTLDTGGTSNPGSVEYARALLLAELGRTEEARTCLRRVFLYPDRNLSHAWARSWSGTSDQ